MTDGRVEQPLRTKVYGARNTGTNYLEGLVAANFDTVLVPGVAPPGAIARRTDRRWMSVLGTETWSELLQRRIDRYFERHHHTTLGWKHTVPTVDRLRAVAGSDVRFVTLTKNPYSWLLSLYRRPYQVVRVPERFAEFVTMRWRPFRREHMSSELASPVELWNVKNGAYLALARALPCLNVTYERLVADPEQFVEDAARTLGLVPRGPSFVNIERSTKNDDVGFDGYRDFYLRERWRAALDARSIALINERLGAGRRGVRLRADRAGSPRCGVSTRADSRLSSCTSCRRTPRARRVVPVAPWSWRHGLTRPARSRRGW